MFTLSIHLVPRLLIRSGVKGAEAYLFTRVQRWNNHVLSTTETMTFFALPLRHLNHWVLLVPAFRPRLFDLYYQTMDTITPMPADILEARMWLVRNIHDKNAVWKVPVPDLLKDAYQEPIYLTDAS